MYNITVVGAIVLALAGMPAQMIAAPTWCAVNHADSIFCEDWDRYCAVPPEDPAEACPAGSPRGEIPPLERPWQDGGAGCSALSLEDFWITSTPFSGRTLSDGDLGNTKMSLGTFIRAKFGQAYTRVVGTDTMPLTLEFVLDGPTQDGKMAAADTYMELANGADQNLTDYVLSDNCASCGDPYAKVYPMICRQTPAPKSTLGACPSILTAPVLPSIAVGALAYLDSHPCHCGETGDHFPHNSHLNFFDGKQWWILKSSLFPGTFQGNGDFRLYARKTQNQTWQESGPNHVKLTIKGTSVKVELDARNSTTSQLEHSECVIPRQYFGSFSLLNMGYAEPCRIKQNGTWECGAIRQCVLGAPGAGTNTYDNIAVSGGMGYNDPGACCVTNENEKPASITCVQANGDLDCITTYNGDFKGPGTVCGAIPCCPTFMPDHDMDGDVDLEDFGWFQTCLSAAQFIDPPTIPCKCANLDNDTDVDTADFVMFANCLTGPGIPAVQNCLGTN